MQIKPLLQPRNETYNASKPVVRHKALIFALIILLQCYVQLTKCMPKEQLRIA